VSRGERERGKLCDRAVRVCFRSGVLFADLSGRSGQRRQYEILIRALRSHRYREEEELVGML